MFYTIIIMICYFGMVFHHIKGRNSVFYRVCSKEIVTQTLQNIIMHVKRCFQNTSKNTIFALQNNKKLFLNI